MTPPARARGKGKRRKLPEPFTQDWLNNGFNSLTAKEARELIFRTQDGKFHIDHVRCYVKSLVTTYLTHNLVYAMLVIAVTGLMMGFFLPSHCRIDYLLGVSTANPLPLVVGSPRNPSVFEGVHRHSSNVVETVDVPSPIGEPVVVLGPSGYFNRFFHRMNLAEIIFCKNITIEAQGQGIVKRLTAGLFGRPQFSLLSLLSVKISDWQEGWKAFANHLKFRRYISGSNLSTIFCRNAQSGGLQIVEIVANGRQPRAIQYDRRSQRASNLLSLQFDTFAGYGRQPDVCNQEKCSEDCNGYFGNKPSSFASICILFSALFIFISGLLLFGWGWGWWHGFNDNPKGLKGRVVATASCACGVFLWWVAAAGLIFLVETS